MVGKSQIKFIKSLQQKKYRYEHQLFVVEGKKTVQELMASDFETYKIYSTDLNFVESETYNVELIKADDLKKMSNLSTPNGYLGVFKIPKPKKIPLQDWIVALDTISDPGNLGTIIRLCDWFGIKNIVTTTNNVDCFNPKVLQATMGSIARVQVTCVDLADFLKTANLPVYGAFMSGTAVHQANFTNPGILVMGNESNGISEEISKLVTKRITINHFGASTTESLNVATATAIILHEIRR
ncbi:RNA methyltransferase [Cellulophaga sp. Hel_I_12]|uniref:TrmH family RNA methyltransferase n=1 Tax=Cellulophaga sp. Hel_I_12 TaxID=1249972 RepID=UPI0006469D25|nr:RNA methyltransferase [Cellulophaga sp. Hel_I_12]